MATELWYSCHNDTSSKNYINMALPHAPLEHGNSKKESKKEIKNRIKKKNMENGEIKIAKPS